MGVSFGGSDSNQQQQTQQQVAQQQSGTTQNQGTYSNGPQNASQILAGLNAAQGIYETGNPTIQAGLGNINAGVGGAQNVFAAANPTLAATLSGQFLQPQGQNPYLDPTYQHAANMLEGQSRSAWGGQDTIPGTSGMQQAALANAQGNLANQLYGGAYQQERGNQQQAIGMLPSYASGLLMPGQAQMQAGYTPIDKYVSQLGAVSPGTQGQFNQNSATNQQLTGTTTGNSQGSGSTFGWNTQAKVKG